MKNLSLDEYLALCASMTVKEWYSPVGEERRRVAEDIAEADAYYADLRARLNERAPA